jgi:hypothetical protein
MSNLTRAMMMGAAGAAGEDKVYVDDVFSTTLYKGNSTNSGAATNQRPQSISNGIELGSFVGVSLNGKTITSITGTPDLSKLNNNIFSSPNTDYYYGTIDCYVDYGSAVVAKFFELAPQGDNTIGAVYNYPDSIISSGSNDATNWTQLAYINYEATDWKEGKFTKHTFQSNTTAYRYYRLDISGNKSVQEWRLGISDPGLGKGGLVWTKSRETGSYHSLFDTERSVSNWIRSDAKDVVTVSNVMNGFNSDGYTLGTDQTYQVVNYLDRDHVSWTFRKEPGFFDIVTYTGTGSARTVAHSLGSVPGMIIVKATTIAEKWTVYHRSVGAGKYLELNEDNAAIPRNESWNNTSPTSTEFTVGIDDEVNKNNTPYVAYIFAHDDASFGTDGDESIIKCGSYTGTNSGGLQTVDVGFEPQWVMIKRTNGDASWFILDSMRGASDAMGLSGSDQPILQPNNTNAETSPAGGGLRVFVTNNGFGWRDQTGNNVSAAGNTFIYMAIRRPNKPPTAGTDVYQALNYNGTAGNIVRDTKFAVDLIHSHRTSGGTPYAIDRMRSGYNYIATTGASDEGPQTSAIHTMGNNFLDMGGGAIINNSGSNYILEMFKRAPGFFDIVTYTGNGTANHAVPHQLGVVPELVFVKTRDFSNTAFPAYTSTGGVTKHMYWGDPAGEATTTAGQMWGPSAFTSTNIYLGSYSNSNYNTRPHVGYLFASLDKISKIGRYAGTGNNINVDCGFIAGARFVMIKRTDTEIAGAAGTNWYYWDSVRGIVSGNDPYMMINQQEVQVTNTDYIDPLSSGFTVTSSASASLNASGGTYLFLAIA